MLMIWQALVLLARALTFCYDVAKQPGGWYAGVVL